MLGMTDVEFRVWVEVNSANDLKEQEVGEGTLHPLFLNKTMKPRVKINGKSPYKEYDYGDTGIVDGYCRGGNDVPYAIVILDKNFRFVMVNIEQLEQIG